MFSLRQKFNLHPGQSNEMVFIMVTSDKSCFRSKNLTKEKHLNLKKIVVDFSFTGTIIICYSKASIETIDLVDIKSGT